MLDNGFDAAMNYTLEQHLELIENIKGSGILTNPLDDTQILNLSQYTLSIPDTATVHIWHVLTDKCFDVANPKRVHQLVIDGDSVGKRFQDMFLAKRYDVALQNLRDLGLCKN